MYKNNTAVIIGAGIGGLATSIFLARKGYHVSLYEQSDTPGGRCSRQIREGHRFDLGATIFLMPGLYRKVFDSLGLSFDSALKSKPLYRSGPFFHDPRCRDKPGVAGGRRRDVQRCGKPGKDRPGTGRTQCFHV
ncbi:MAG TPA: FAD-dependent oxidoreductase [Bacteroidales bacterium]|nr:FAD-dependent oxidoreductase [Bacteroidales bacterium]